MDTDILQNSRWILLPGTLCTGHVFDGVLDALGVAANQRHTHQLCTPDIADYRAIFENDVKAGDIICGFSLGAIIAAHHANVNHTAAALILFGINPLADDPAKADGRHALQADVLASGGRAALANRVPALHGPHPQIVRQQILDMADESATHIAAQTSLALSRPDAMNTLRACPVPVRVFCGSRDDQTPPHLAKRVAQAAPNGRCTILPDLGHYALLEDPVACAAAIKSTFNATDPE